MDAGRKPLARSTDLIVEELGDELLVYDEQTNRGHCLSPNAARVWRRCDGRTPVAGLSAQVDLDAETVDRALDELMGCGLLESGRSANGGTTRRELTIRLAKAGGAVAAAPLIVSITAPTPAAAQSPPEGCELVASGGCSGNCGQATGCKNDNIGCTCCNLRRIDCGDLGPFERSASIKLCVLGSSANCPPNQDPAGAFCTTPCAPRRVSQTPEGRQVTGDQAASPSSTPSTPQTPTPSEAAPTTPTTPTSPTPSAPTVEPTPQPQAPAPEPTPAPVPEPAPAPPAPDPATTTTTTTPAP